MKLSKVVSSLVLMSLHNAANGNNAFASLRGSKENNRRALRVQHPCTLVQIETEYEDEIAEAREEPAETTNESRSKMYSGSGAGGDRKLHEGEDFRFKCELQEEDRAAAGKYFVPINGIDTNELENIVSGDTTMLAEGATIMDGEMWLPVGAAIEFGSNGRRKLQEASRSKGTKKVLVVRANANDMSTASSKAVLSDKIFGTNGDIANLKSQYDACSHGQLQFQPFQGMTSGGTNVVDGVIEVNINMNVADSSRYAVEDAMEEAADKIVGNLSEQFDHVMLCLPPGSRLGATNKNWVAYAYVNSWLAVFNDGFCESLTTQVHEIGHNLGLAHAGKDNISYGDKSGMMGFSYRQDNGPLQCFNPAKSYQLGWYDDKVVEIDPEDGTWVGTLIGAVDYKNDSVDQNSKVVVKITSPDRTNLYVGYNRKKGMNSGVPLAGDRVTIVEQGLGYSSSNFVGNLSPDDPIHTFYSFGGSNKNLVVEFIDRKSYYNEVTVAIYYDTCIYPSCCNGRTCNTNGFKPSPIGTPAPQPLPSPVASPTPKPTPHPTPAPAPPTPAPTRDRMHTGATGSRSRPLKLLTENFREGLGAFYGGGNAVAQNIFQYIATAKFQLKQSTEPPYIGTDLNLQGNSIVQVNFWYNAQQMETQEGFRLQYSTDHGVTWSDVRRFSFGSTFKELDAWKFVNAATFQVQEGLSTAKLRFVGETSKNDSNSVFYIAGVNIYGIEK
mmetsp:Transcript_22863/g.53988  ORF Transcript_22863/g.53988 Transcript_22863/m.53988 type:complete len:722 (-) Transcript_22863:213-2378(-)|eukprot:CAMPEP_0172400284 /NCGR_PEP_ID=MMETSP1061-20121228/45163_1 /TAXON_ID=37318 /ORGANISM="Pseudo-nitzschia pungens, Strain cf. pungens" /LENGTH=721 /DNA_ID=CAMNT_0013133469 /DNA_START=61 /DNA_END=2226 /DNA_ORIENTATION=-